MKRLHIRRTYKVSKVLLVIFLLIFFLTFFLLRIYDTKISPKIMTVAEARLKKFTESFLSNNVGYDLFTNDALKDILVINKNEAGEIEMIDYDTYLVSAFLRDISDNIADTLKEEETNTDRIAFYIPLGSITQNPLFNSRGPKIPVRMEIIGSVLSSVKTTVTEYGINNCLIEMVVEVEVTEKVILPVITDTVTIVNEFPISYKVIQGKIPTYYGDSINKSSSIYSLPIEQK